VVEQVTVNHLAGGSNPSWGASLNVVEVPVATKRLGEDRNVKSEITDRSASTPQ
jgi:hypothetical protein